MSALVHSPVGLLHFIAAGVALVTGALVLLWPKATRRHIRAGYVYTASMCVMLVTAFAIYNLYGSFGIFHWLAVVSTLTLAGGMVPVLLKRPTRTYVALHFSFMYWSVVGLYMAFAAETLVRLPQVVIEGGVPNQTFYAMVIGSMVVLGIIANVVWYRMKHRWAAQFAVGGALREQEVTGR